MEAHAIRQVGRTTADSLGVLCCAGHDGLPRLPVPMLPGSADGYDSIQIGPALRLTRIPV